jgi:hypothetical protein
VKTSALAPMLINFFQANQFDLSCAGLVVVGINYHLQVFDIRPIALRLNESADWRFRTSLLQAVEKRLLSMAAPTLKELKLGDALAHLKKQVGGSKASCLKPADRRFDLIYC